MLYEGCFKSSDLYLQVVALCRDIFWRHTMRHPKELALTLILMLILSRCTVSFKETKSATMNIFQDFFLKSFVIVELSYVFTINLFTKAENCTEK